MSALQAAARQSPVARAIGSAAPRGSSLAVWGFSANLILESGHVQGNRYGFTYWQAEKSPLQEDFISEYVSDLSVSKPVLFVDAMAPGMFYSGSSDRRSRHYRAYPRIARLIDAEYELVTTVEGVEIYRRKSFSS